MKKRSVRRHRHHHQVHHHHRRPAQRQPRLLRSIIANFKGRRRRTTAFIIALVLIFFGMAIYQNIQASHLLNQAKNKMNQSQFEAAAIDLKAAGMPLLLSGLKDKILAAQNQNETWIYYSLEVERADFLVKEGKYDDANAVLERISQDFPNYDKVVALRSLILAKIADLPKPTAATSRPNRLASRDVAPANIDRHLNQPAEFKPVPPAESICYQINGLSTRSEADRPDENDGYQFHIIYALPSDGSDRGYDNNGQIATAVSAWQNWLCLETGGKTLKLDTYQGKLDVSFVRLEASDEALSTGSELPWKTNPNSNPYIYSDINNRLQNLGFNKANKAYLVYYDGTSNYSCGSAGSNGMLYLRGSMCRLAGLLTNSVLEPGYWEFAMLHEAMHALGFVPACAPDFSAHGHVAMNSADLMYSGDEAWSPSELDASRRNYYQHGRADCLDLARSAFLTGGGAELPPWH